MPDPTTALENLRQALKRLASDALADDDFARARELTQLLHHVSGLEERLQRILDTDVHETDPETFNFSAPQTHDRYVASPLPDYDYPRFIRRGRDIVKIGLNRTKTDTYEQKLSRRDFDKIGQVLIGLGTRRFNAQTVISRTSLSSYLVYLMLGLLDERELVESPARGEYRFSEGLSREGLDELWNEV